MKKLRNLACIAFAGSLALSAPQAKADVISFQQGENEYNSVTDTHITNADPNATYNNLSFFSVDQSSNGSVYQALINFQDLFGHGENQIPFGADIFQANLFLQTAGGSGDSIELYEMLQSWNSGATWNSFTNGIQANGLEATLSPISISPQISDGDLINFDVTQTLQFWAQDLLPNYGWALISSGTDGIDIYSSEGRVVPRLEVQYTPFNPENPVPEPKTLTLFASGLAGAYVFSKRKK